jgi:hypothetical protein
LPDVGQISWPGWQEDSLGLQGTYNLKG